MKLPAFDWRPFELVAELPLVSPAAYGPEAISVLSVLAKSANPKYRYYLKPHWIAVFWDEDRDTRVLEALAYLVWSSPLVLSQIRAIGERKGNVTVWTAPDPSPATRGAIEYAARSCHNPRIQDEWSFTIFAVHLPTPKAPDPVLFEMWEDGEHRRPATSSVDATTRLLIAVNELYPLGEVLPTAAEAAAEARALVEADKDEFAPLESQP